MRQSNQMLQQKRDHYSKKIRRDQRQKIFQKIRLEMLNTVTRTEPFQNNLKDGQLEIIESIDQYYKNQQALDFEAMNSYLCANQVPVIEQLSEKLVKLIFTSFNKNPRALACIANMLSKFEDYDFFEKDIISQHLENLLTDNFEAESQSFSNPRVLTFLLYQMLRLTGQKQLFTLIKPYYKAIIKGNGYFDLVTLLLLAQVSSFRCLLPSRQIIEGYLNNNIYYQQINQISLYKLCELLDNNLRYDQTSSLYQQYSNWIERRLIQKSFPLKLKPDLIKLMIMIINSVDGHNQFIEYFSKLGVLKEISYLARFGNSDCKIASLQFMIALIGISNQQLLNCCVEEHLLIEILAYSLDLKIESELINKILVSLIIIFNFNRQYIRRGYQIGMRSILMKLLDNKYPKKIIETGLLLQQFLNDSQIL